MSRHNPVASRRRRLPYLAKIKRDDASAERTSGRSRPCAIESLRRAITWPWLARGCGLSRVPLRDVGKGARQAQLATAATRAEARHRVRISPPTVPSGTALQGRQTKRAATPNAL